MLPPAGERIWVGPVSSLNLGDVPQIPRQNRRQIGPRPNPGAVVSAVRGRWLRESRLGAPARTRIVSDKWPPLFALQLPLEQTVQKMWGVRPAISGVRPEAGI